MVLQPYFSDLLPHVILAQKVWQSHTVMVTKQTGEGM